jgi:thiamine kinase-like enzyme
MERKRFYNNSLTRQGNTVIKESQWPVDKEALDILIAEHPNFLPKILDYDSNSIIYEYIEGISVGKYLKEIKANAQDMVDIYVQINDIWKNFLDLSKKHCKGKMIYHNDLHLYNMLHKDGKVILTDIDSIVISNHVSFQTTHSYLFHQMEELLYARIQK